ncbi:MAG TPA: CBS domain-containing protein [candidate division Zixibacteria bacterium]|nr:CBS domain-containing protein [candidate division Zixibacteria bacterium]
MNVRDKLESKSRELITCPPDTTIINAMNLMLENEIGCLPVQGQAGDLLGLVSDKDIFKAVFENQDAYKELTVKDIMAEDMVVGVPSDDIDYMAALMTKNNIRHVPIMENKKLIGIISAGDVVRARMKSIVAENRYLKMYMEGTNMH